MLQVLDRIEYGAVRRKLHQRDVLGHVQRLAGVEAGPIPDDHRIFSRRNRAGELSEEGVDRRGVELRAQQPFAVARLGADGTDDPQVTENRSEISGVVWR